MDKFEEDKQGLIDLVVWYRDKYHKMSGEEFHNEIIESISQCKNNEELEIYYRLTDSWLDND